MYLICDVYTSHFMIVSTKLRCVQMYDIIKFHVAIIEHDPICFSSYNINIYIYNWVWWIYLKKAEKLPLTNKITTDGWFSENPVVEIIFYRC